MFDTIHRKEGRGPRLVPLLATFFVNSIACAIVVVATQAPAGAVVEAPDDSIEVMVPLRAPPAPATAKASGRPKAGASQSPKAVQSVAAVEASKVPAPEASSTLALAPADSGQGGPGAGGPGGGGDGDGDGGSGDDDGPPGGANAPLRIVHWSEARLLNACSPEMPKAMQDLGRSEEQCLVDVTLDSNGRVVGVNPAACPAFLEKAAIEAARCSSFAGVGEPVRFRFRYVFRLN